MPHLTTSDLFCDPVVDLEESVSDFLVNDVYPDEQNIGSEECTDDWPIDSSTSVQSLRQILRIPVPIDSIMHTIQSQVGYSRVLLDQSLTQSLPTGNGRSCFLSYIRRRTETTYRVDQRWVKNNRDPDTVVCVKPCHYRIEGEVESSTEHLRNFLEVVQTIF